MIISLANEYPEGFNYSMAQEFGGEKLHQIRDMKLLVHTCNEMARKQALSIKKGNDNGYIILIPRVNQSVELNKLNQEEQRILTMIKETKMMGKLWLHLKQETKGEDINKLKTIVARLVSLKLIRKFTSPKYGKKVLYIHKSFEPDECHSWTWYKESTQEFDGQFVKHIKDLALRKLQIQKSEAEKKYKDNPLLQLKCSRVTANDVIKYFEELSGKGNTLLKDRNLSVKDIEVILNTFCLTGQAECRTSTNEEGVETKQYMMVNPFLDEEHGSVITQTPCGLCSLTDQCGVGNLISPLTCEYMKDTLDGLNYLDW